MFVKNQDKSMIRLNNLICLLLNELVSCFEEMVREKGNLGFKVGKGDGGQGLGNERRGKGIANLREYQWRII